MRMSNILNHYNFTSAVVPGYRTVLSINEPEQRVGETG